MIEHFINYLGTFALLLFGWWFTLLLIDYILIDTNKEHWKMKLWKWITFIYIILAIYFYIRK